jgi:hypothetical protein
MGRNNAFQRGMRDLKQRVRRVVETAAAKEAKNRARSSPGSASANSFDDVNIVIAENIGRPGGQVGASASQHVRIRQDRRDHYKDSGTTPTGS